MLLSLCLRKFDCRVGTGRPNPSSFKPPFSLLKGVRVLACHLAFFWGKRRATLKKVTAAASPSVLNDCKPAAAALPVVVAERLRRWARKPLGSPRVGSNPADYGALLLSLRPAQKKAECRFSLPASCTNAKSLGPAALEVMSSTSTSDISQLEAHSHAFGIGMSCALLPAFEDLIIQTERTG